MDAETREELNCYVVATLGIAENVSAHQARIDAKLLVGLRNHAKELLADSERIAVVEAKCEELESIVKEAVPLVRVCSIGADRVGNTKRLASCVIWTDRARIALAGDKEAAT